MSLHVGLSVEVAPMALAQLSLYSQPWSCCRASSHATVPASWPLAQPFALHPGPWLTTAKLVWQRWSCLRNHKQSLQLRAGSLVTSHGHDSQGGLVSGSVCTWRTECVSIWRTW